MIAASSSIRARRNFVRLGGMLRGRGRSYPRSSSTRRRRVCSAAPIRSWRSLARTYLDLGDADRAIAVIEPARELYSELAGLNATLGSAWMRKGELAKGGAVLEAAIATSPFDPSVHCGLAVAYIN